MYSSSEIQRFTYVTVALAAMVFALMAWQLDHWTHHEDLANEIVEFNHARFLLLGVLHQLWLEAEGLFLDRTKTKSQWHLGGPS